MSYTWINRYGEELTCRPTPSLEHQIDRTSTIDINKINSSNTRFELASEGFRGGDHRCGFAAGHLDTKGLFRRMSTNKRPFFLGALQEGIGKAHLKTVSGNQNCTDNGLTFSTRDICAVVYTQLSKWLSYSMDQLNCSMTASEILLDFQPLLKERGLDMSIVSMWKRLVKVWVPTRFAAPMQSFLFCCSHRNVRCVL